MDFLDMIHKIHLARNSPSERMSGVRFSLWISLSISRISVYIVQSVILLQLSVGISEAYREQNFILQNASSDGSLSGTTERIQTTTPNSAEISCNNEAVILIHGFCRTHRDMLPLKQSLVSKGYRVITPDFPTFTGTLDDCSKKLAVELHKIDGTYDRIHFVGHSIGGLILRQFLSGNRVHRLGRCVLIATPNDGTELAAIVSRYFKPLVWIFKPYQALQPGGVEIPPPLNNPAPEMGALAGNNSNLFFGRLLKRENDGRVPVDSVPFEGMKECIVVPYGHREIHHRQDVAELVHRFLQNGEFVVKSEE